MWILNVPAHFPIASHDRWLLIINTVSLSVRLPEPSAFLGSRGGAGPACRTAARAAEERQGATVVSAHCSGVGYRRPEGREADLGPGARSARWETARRALVHFESAVQLMAQLLWTVSVHRILLCTGLWVILNNWRLYLRVNMKEGLSVWLYIVFTDVLFCLYQVKPAI